MEFTAEVEQEEMALSVAIRHMGHNIQEDFAQIELQEVQPDSNEPRILCSKSLECRDVEFVPRE